MHVDQAAPMTKRLQQAAARRIVVNYDEKGSL